MKCLEARVRELESRIGALDRDRANLDKQLFEALAEIDEKDDELRAATEHTAVLQDRVAELVNVQYKLTRNYEKAARRADRERARADKAESERDEARRDVCALVADRNNDLASRAWLKPVVDGERAAARARGWDPEQLWPKEKP